MIEQHEETLQKKKTAANKKTAIQTSNSANVASFPNKQTDKIPKLNTPKSAQKTSSSKSASNTKKTVASNQAKAKPKGSHKGKKRKTAGLHKFFTYIESVFTTKTFILTVSLIAVALFLIGMLIGVKVHKSLTDKQDIHLYITKASKEFNVPYDVIYAVIQTESGFDPNAKSDADARGLMQITEITLKDLNNRGGTNYDMRDLYDPEINIRLGTYYLSILYKRFGVYETVYAAYNAGPTKVDQWLKDASYSNDGKTLLPSKIPFPETKRYVEKVVAARENYLASHD